MLVGDANSDNTINDSDRTRIQQYLAGTVLLTNEQKIAADVDSNFEITSNDYLKLMLYIDLDENGDYFVKSIY